MALRLVLGTGTTGYERQRLLLARSGFDAPGIAALDSAACSVTRSPHRATPVLHRGAYGHLIVPALQAITVDRRCRKRTTFPNKALRGQCGNAEPACWPARCVSIRGTWDNPKTADRDRATFAGAWGFCGADRWARRGNRRYSMPFQGEAGNRPTRRGSCLLCSRIGRHRSRNGLGSGYLAMSGCKAGSETLKVAGDPRTGQNGERPQPGLERKTNLVLRRGLRWGRFFR